MEEELKKAQKRLDRIFTKLSGTLDTNMNEMGFNGLKCVLESLKMVMELQREIESELQKIEKRK